MSTTVHTWADCRGAFLPSVYIDVETNNINYVPPSGGQSGFMSTNTESGLVRQNVAYWKGAFFLPDLFINTTTNIFGLNVDVNPSIMDDREVDELVGETVTTSGPSSFVITAAYSASPYQSVPGTHGGLLTIGKLTAF